MPIEGLQIIELEKVSGGNNWPFLDWLRGTPPPPPPPPPPVYPMEESL